MNSQKNTNLLRFSCKGTAIHALLILITLFMLTGCPLEKETSETVTIDELVWEASRDPIGFDTYLDTKTLDPRTSSCFRQYRDTAFSSEQAKLLECGVILMGSPAWNDCHEDAEAFERNGVLMNDIAGAIDGPGNFDETSAYSYLVISKSLLTEVDWDALIDALRDVTPTYSCEYKDEEWVWE